MDWCHYRHHREILTWETTYRWATRSVRKNLGSWRIEEWWTALSNITSLQNHLQVLNCVKSCWLWRSYHTDEIIFTLVKPCSEQTCPVDGGGVILQEARVEMFHNRMKLIIKKCSKWGLNHGSEINKRPPTRYYHKKTAYFSFISSLGCISKSRINRI